MIPPKHEPKTKTPLKAFPIGVVFGMLNTLIIVIVLKLIAFEFQFAG